MLNLSQMTRVIAGIICALISTIIKRSLSFCCFLQGRTELKNRAHSDRIVHISMSDGVFRDRRVCVWLYVCVCVCARLFACVCSSVTGWWMPPQFCQPSTRLTIADWSCPPRMQCCGGKGCVCVFICLCWCHVEPTSDPRSLKLSAQIHCPQSAFSASRCQCAL